MQRKGASMSHDRPPSQKKDRREHCKSIELRGVRRLLWTCPGRRQNPSQALGHRIAIRADRLVQCRWREVHVAST
eukprot:scaffold10092_cov123-Amphora_coffeaeformis.AAC.4